MYLTDKNKEYLIYDGLLNKIRRIYFSKLTRNFVKDDSKSVLDFGCGPGDLIQFIQEVAPSAIGIDNSRRSVEIAKKRKIPNIYLGDESNLGNYGPFDIVYMQSVLEHVPNPIETLSQIKNHLKDNGIVIISVPTPSSNFWDDPTHVRPFTPKSMEMLGDILEMKVQLNSYVFSYLLGIKIRNQITYKLLNLIPYALGSNILVVLQKEV